MTKHPDPTEPLEDEDLFRPPKDHPYIFFFESDTDPTLSFKQITVYTPDRTRHFTIWLRSTNTVIHETGADDLENALRLEIPLPTEPEEAWNGFRQLHDLPRARDMVVAIVEPGPDGIPTIRPPGAPPFSEYS